MISLLPLGGYVKLAGQDDFGKVELDPNDKSMYYSKPAWQRLLIVFAGPFMNFLIGWAVFTMVFHSGMDVSYNPKKPGKVGIVFKNSPAYKAGIKTNDEILKINDTKINSWNKLIELSFNPQTDVYKMLIKRNNKTFIKNVAPEKKGKRYILGVAQYDPPIIGSLVVSKLQNNKLLPGDEILKIDNRKIVQWSFITEYLFSKANKIVNFKIIRNNKIKNIKVKINSNDLGEVGFLNIKFFKNYKSDYFMTTNMISENNKKLGLLKGDLIKKLILYNPKTQTEITSYDINNGFDFMNYIFTLKGKNVKIVILRKGKKIVKDVIVGSKNMSMGYLEMTPKQYMEYYSYKDSFKKSLKKTKDLIVQTFQVVGKIFSRKMQAKDVLGGPITIWKISVASAEAGYKHFLSLLAIISLNLGFINLLPIPVIDGGHIVIYIYEMIVGKMPSEKIMNVIQQVGLAFIIFLMVFTFYIDIIKL